MTDQPSKWITGTFLGDLQKWAEETLTSNETENALARSNAREILKLLDNPPVFLPATHLEAE